MSRDQKRKIKLEKEAKRTTSRRSLAYRGSKYRREELIPAYFQTELAIYEGFVISDRTCTDLAVVESLETMILEMRDGTWPPLDATAQDDSGKAEAEAFFSWNIRMRWEKMPQPISRHDKIGILRSILDSISVWTTKSPDSQGYLRYLEGFLTKKFGVTVQKMTTDNEPLDDDDQDDDFLELGRAWLINGDLDAKVEFQEYAEELLEEGEADRVAETCQQLIGETSRDIADPVLQDLALRAHRMTHSL